MQKISLYLIISLLITPLITKSYTRKEIINTLLPNTIAVCTAGIAIYIFYSAFTQKHTPDVSNPNHQHDCCHNDNDDYDNDHEESTEPTTEKKETISTETTPEHEQHTKNDKTGDQKFESSHQHHMYNAFDQFA